jgi:putative Mg2+ transporter-C (MgtC) family protein
MSRGYVNDGEAILRIAVAAGLGLLVGLERLIRGNPAGPRTFSLLGIGAATFAVVAGGYGNDGRVIAGVATGVGFIGAGMIFHDSARGVVGFATAAASWAIVAIGVMAGVGRVLVALAITGIALIVLELQYVGITSWAASHTSLHRLDNDSDPGAGGERED